MEQEKKLKVTAKCGSHEYSEIARPYNKNVQDEQVETCVKSIYRQIADVGKEEMMDDFQLTRELIE